MFGVCIWIDGVLDASQLIDDNVRLQLSGLAGGHKCKI